MALLLAVPIYLPRMMRSFWVDESGTFWMAHEGFWSAVDKCMHYAGQSVLYGALASMFCLESGPLREPLLRLPSLIGLGVALYFTARLAERAFGAGAGLCAFLFLLFQPSSADWFIQSRPYGLAAGAVAASCCLLWEWTERRALRTALWWALATALVFYLHYLYALVFVAQGAFLLWVFAVERRAEGWKQLAAAMAAVGVALLPLAGHFALASREASTMPALMKPSLLYAVMVGLPLSLLIQGVLVATLLLFVWRVWGSPRRLWKVRGGGAWVLIGGWFVAGPLILFASAHLLGFALFEPRYLGHAAPALALLLAGMGMMAFPARVAMRWAFLSVVLSTGSPMTWEKAAETGYAEALPAIEAVRNVTPGEPPPLLFHSTLLESNFHDWKKGPEGSRLFHELIAYPVKNRVYPLPMRLDTAEYLYLEGLLDGELKDAPTVLFMRFGDVPEGLKRSMAMRGYRVETVTPNGYSVGIFRRDPVR
jgi:hypothetical protein